MKQVIYFIYTSGKARAFREDAETVFDFSTGRPIAFIDSGTWFSWSEHQPIAFEDDKTVYDWKTHKPIYFMEKR